MLRYKILYSTVCNTGKVRSINQDNFWCIGKYLEEQNNALESPLNGSIENDKLPVFAVFDGMGGEQKGETAAYLAADTFNRNYYLFKNGEFQDVFTDVFRNINTEICKYKSEHGIPNMGTTGAALAFDTKKVYYCNIGDSRIYQLKKMGLKRISVDHCLQISENRKAPLTQYLGVPEDEFIIQPHVSMTKLRNKERFIICSDGLTDMVNESDIEKVLSSECSVSDCSNTLLNMALSNGGRDNITIIVCEIQKLRRNKE